MRISNIRMAGFRGVRGEAALPFAHGFVVIAGRNGSGKSTVCDAIEFALTGQIRGASEHTEKREGIGDYIWWRGGNFSHSRYVELTLTSEEGDSVVIRRTPTQCTVTPNAKLEELLCHNAVSVDVPLAQLCRTTILRDEEITRLSVDLKEADRFEFVRGALGTADFTSIERKARDVQEILSRELQIAEARYDNAKSRVADLITRLSQAKTEVSKATDVVSAEQVLRKMLGEQQDGADLLMVASERRVATLRLRLDSLDRLALKLDTLRTRFSRTSDPEIATREAALADELATIRSTITADEKTLTALSEELAFAQANDPRIASLAAIHEHGSRLGMTEGCCPLCGSRHTSEEFSAKLASIEKEVLAANTYLADLTKRSADISLKLTAMRTELVRLESEVDAHKVEKEKAKHDKEDIEKEAARLNVVVVIEDTERSLERIRNEAESLNKQILTFDQNLAVLQSSLAVERLGGLEQELQDARDEQKSTDQQLMRGRSALNKAKESLDTIRRVRGEYVDEQLAQLEPLMAELYQRLRPHVDWPIVRYRLRGDVRKMLSLEVGDGLNPSFVFSSGQRRAAGLAFLLAVHLSRSWCKLRSLILDDPVQHIDDFRALHLTEVLAAIRTTGRQVICTVEDESLGRLLCRRLRSDSDGAGVFIKMAYSSRDGAEVESITPIQPLREHVLVPA